MKTLADIQNELSGIYQQIADSGDCPAHLRADIEKKAKKQIAFLKKCEIAFLGQNWRTKEYFLNEVQDAENKIQAIRDKFQVWKKAGNAPLNCDPKKLWAIWAKINRLELITERVRVLSYVLGE